MIRSQAGSLDEVRRWADRHAATHKVLIMLPPHVIEQFHEVFPQFETDDWMPAVALENEDFETIQPKLEELFDDRKQEQSIRLSQMLQNFNSVMQTINANFWQKGREHHIRNGRGEPADYYFQQMIDVNAYVRSTLMLSYIEGYGELWQMQIDDEWIHYCNDPDREEDAAEALAANRLRRRGGLYQRDGRTPAVARQNRAAAVRASVPKPKAKAHALRN